MVVLKTALRILFLFLLCIPIIYLECYILKNTASDIKKKRQNKTNLSKDNKEKHYNKTSLRVAK